MELFLLQLQGIQSEPNQPKIPTDHKPLLLYHCYMSGGGESY